jgi:dihydrolipoamide dehydrogenase
LEAYEDRFDLIVIGAGPGGYAAAVRAAELGMKTACIERDARPGGVCLNVGCIPSKALLESTEYYRLAKDGLGEHAISVKEVLIDLAALMERKEKIVSGLSENVRKLMEQSGVRLIRGLARLVSNTEVEVLDPEQAAAGRYHAGALLLATGSEPVQLPFLPFDGERVVSSTEALRFESVPERLGVVGGGYIGLELGSVWSRLGSKVTLIEVLPRIAVAVDGQVSRLLERLLRREGLDFRLKTKVIGAEKTEGGMKLSLDSNDGLDEAEFDRVLVAVGRKPLTGTLGLDQIGIRLDPKGFIVVDENYRTSVPGVYAIGDLIPGPMLAHKASAEGRAAVERMTGYPGEVNYDAIPSIIYTSPEVASVGKTEEELKGLGADYRLAVYQFSGTGRARCLGQTDGFVKILAHRRSGRILGAHIIGPRASELIAECVSAIEFHASVKDLGHIIHAHPTLSEAVHESASMLIGRD